MSHEQWNIFRALAEWRERNGKDIQAVVKVSAKLVFRSHLRKITARCRHHPNVHPKSLRAAQTFEFLFLQYAEQFGLQRDGPGKAPFS